jgi:hypothetical protein
VPDSEQPSETVDVVYLPYLPLRERALIGDWELIPRRALVDDDCLDQRSGELAQGLAAMYVLPKRGGNAAGAFARPRQGRIGEAARDLQSLSDLRRACVVTVLDPNPSPLLSADNRDLNAGHWMLTSENAMLVAHGISRDGGYTGTITGSRVPFTSLGVSVLDKPGTPHRRRGEILPPGDVRIPTFSPPAFDSEYADATWESIRRGDAAARRLARAIDWLGLASLNTTAMTDDLRIPALRAGFEVLLDTGDYLKLGRRLGRVLEDDSEPTERTWKNLSGSETTKRLGDVAWWSVRLSFLRNALMHGGSPRSDDWIHGGLAHTDLGEWYLRQAIKHAVAKDGHTDVLQELLWRAALRETREALRSRHGQGLGTGE